MRAAATTPVLVLVLGASLTTCRLDKLINPSFADRLTVSADSLQASANVGSLVARELTVLVASADGATLPWTATKTAAWVTLEPPGGQAPATVIVKLHPDTLSQTPHRDTIVFTSSQSIDTVRVPVIFDMLPAAADLSLSDTVHADTAFVRSAQPDTFSLRIKNTGALPLTWTAALDTGWVTLSDSGGTVPPQDTTSTIVLVTLRPESLSTGAHTSRIIFNAPGAEGAPDTVRISYTIDPCVERGVVPDTVVAASLTLSDCGAPLRAGSQAKLYRVQAAVGDTLTVRLSGAFDAYLVLTDGLGASLAQNDDCPAQTGPACILEYRVPAAGPYIIEATTKTAADTGAFALSIVRERAPSAPQAAGQFRKDSTVAIGVGAVTPEDTVVFKATIHDPNPRDSVRFEIEVTPVGSAFSNSPTHLGGFVAVAPGGRVAAVRASGLSENTGYHWQARTCDKAARCSAWLGFGNPDPAADFYVNAVFETPAFGNAPNQFGPGGGAIPPGGGTGGSAGSTVTVTFRAAVTDPDPGDLIAIEVEVKPNAAAFDGTGLTRGSGVATSATASVGVGFTVPLLLADNYHWRARACDQTNRCGAWVPFGSSPDFHVP